MTKQQYHTHISSKHRWMELNLKEVWQYRDLIMLFVKRDFTVAYKQTVLGPAWIFLTPLFSSIVHAFVFGGIAGIETNGVPALLFYLCSNAVWGFFSTCLTHNANTFTANAYMFGKVYFPRLATPIANVIASVIRFMIQMILVLLFLVYFIFQGAIHPNWLAWLLIPVELVHLGVLGMGFGIIISSLTTKYRDLTVLVDFGVSLWMYATPIVYPMSTLADGWIKNILLINPVTASVEMMRYAILGSGEFYWGYYILSWAITVVVALLGVIIFNKVERNFMDTV
ncbi:MAG: ABC transporter permease [Oscillospiraceae bacterium]|nr:ABC transporter permease [Oscillospiraceae bacterium]